MTTARIKLDFPFSIHLYQAIGASEMDLKLLARQALLVLMQEELPSLSGQMQKQDSATLSFGPSSAGPVRFWQCQELPTFPVSIAHTRPAIAAAAINPVKDGRPIGIDIEWEDRRTPEGLDRWVGMQLELSLLPLQIWVIKEAIFKACQTQHEFLELGDVPLFKNMHLTKMPEIQNACWQGRFDLDVLCGEWILKSILVSDRRLLVAQAYLNATSARD